MSEKEQLPGFTEEFRSSIVDFTTDLKNTFPEYNEHLQKWTNSNTTDCDFQELFEYCLKIYPERFFDILNQNKSLFSYESTINTEFLPNIDFKMLYNSDGLSDKTKETIEMTTVVGLVIKMGDLCYKDKDRFPNGPWCKEGQFVIYGRYAGARFKTKYGEHRILNDDEIIGTIKKPEDILALF